MLSRDADLESKTVTVGGDSEEIMAGQIQVRAPVLFENINKTINVATNGAKVKDVISKMTLTIGTSSSTWTPNQSDTGDSQDATFE
jgi:hypothetical protein